MIPVMQTITGDRGNCLTAAIASLMERKIEDVDYFFEGVPEGDEDTPDGVKKFSDNFNNFLYKNGYGFIQIEPDNIMETIKGMNGFFIVSGKSPRGYEHAVIYNFTGMVHDPHPASGGVEPKTILLIYPLFHASQLEYQESLKNIEKGN